MSTLASPPNICYNPLIGRRRKQKPKRKKKLFFPANFNIEAAEVFVVSDEGKGLGKMTRDEAIKIAQGQGLDLVVVNQKNDPPIAKVLDFKKFLYEETKKERGGRQSKKGGLKQLRLKPNIAEHDLKMRIDQAQAFLEEGNSVKFVVHYIGREIVHKSLGQEKLAGVLKALEGVAEPEKAPWFEGKRLIVVLRPR
ncbi:translation initiation factor IF-3 [Patescibacteria group bacterium]|nr:translation initiation factor IF-3 [Patescibacteria group bacterium]